MPPAVRAWMRGAHHRSSAAPLPPLLLRPAVPHLLSVPPASRLACQINRPMRLHSAPAAAAQGGDRGDGRRPCGPHPGAPGRTNPARPTVEPTPGRRSCGTMLVGSAGDVQDRSPVAVEATVRSLSEAPPDLCVEALALPCVHGDVAGERVEQRVSKALSMISTLGKPARLRRAAAARSGPISTHVTRKPRRARGKVAFPLAHPTSNSRSPAVTPAVPTSAP